MGLMEILGFNKELERGEIPLYKIIVSLCGGITYYGLHLVSVGLANAYAMLMVFLLFAGWESYQ